MHGLKRTGQSNALGLQRDLVSLRTSPRGPQKPEMSGLGRALSDSRRESLAKPHRTRKGQFPRNLVVALGLGREGRVHVLASGCYAMIAPNRSTDNCPGNWSKNWGYMWFKERGCLVSKTINTSADLCEEVSGRLVFLLNGYREIQ